jgi:hypothetical protein
MWKQETVVMIVTHLYLNGRNRVVVVRSPSEKTTNDDDAWCGRLLFAQPVIDAVLVGIGRSTLTTTENSMVGRRLCPPHALHRPGNTRDS